MSTEDNETLQNSQDEKAESEKELTQEELDQAAGGAINPLKPTAPTVSPEAGLIQKVFKFFPPTT